MKSLKEKIAELIKEAGTPLFFYADGDIAHKRFYNKQLVGYIGDETFALDCDVSQIGQSSCHVSGKVLNVGNFVFQNGKISPYAKAYEKPIGVVAWVNPIQGNPQEAHAWVLGLDEQKMEWSSCFAFSKANSMVDGLKNTRILAEYEKQSQADFKAIKFCLNYEPYGNKVEETFLPAKNQWRKIFANQDVINTSLTMLSAPLLEGWYGSSTDWSYNYMVAVNADSGDADIIFKVLKKTNIRCAWMI